MEKAIKIIVECVCFPNYLIYDRLAHDWLKVNVNNNNDKKQNEKEGGYNFQLLQKASSTECRE